MQKEIRKPGYLHRRKAKWAYMFLAPWLILLVVFRAYPLLYGIIVSFTDYSLRGMKFVGVDNYVSIFQDYAFWRSLKAMLMYCVLVIPFRTLIPLWIANTLRSHGKLVNTTAKLLLYLPGVVCSTAITISWRIMLAPGTGVVNELAKSLGFGVGSLLDNSNTSIPILSALIVFSNLGSNVIIYSAALGAVPSTYYEAAELDGASHITQLLKITIPLLWPTVVYVFITSTIATLQIYLVPKLMTGGGPNYTTSSLLMLIYDSAFIKGKFGYASAIGVLLFVLTAVIAFIQFKVTRRERVEY